MVGYRDLGLVSWWDGLAGRWLGGRVDQGRGAGWRALGSTTIARNFSGRGSEAYGLIDCPLQNVGGKSTQGAP